MRSSIYDAEQPSTSNGMDVIAHVGDYKTNSTNVEENSRLFRQVMRELRLCLWYWGAISARQAGYLLRDRPVGTFLVRDSHSESSIFAISYVTSGGIFHSRLTRFNKYFCLGGPNSLIRSTSLVELIERTMKSSMSVLMHNTAMNLQHVSIRHPLSRTEFMPSLKYFCRLAIVRKISDTGGRIETLPLPSKLLIFLRSKNYLLVC